MCILGSFATLVSQFSDLVGNNRKAFSCLTCSCSLNGSIESKKVCLVGDCNNVSIVCSKFFKIDPNQTLAIAQELYEKKLTTYPRTDARVLTTAVAKEITKNIRGLQSLDEVSGAVKNILENGRYKGLEKTSYTDDSKVTDHYAIIPTGQTAAIGSLE